jgi:hypothetical protein
MTASEDQEMSDISDPPLMWDSDVVGSGATLPVSSNTVDIDVDTPSAGEAIPHVSSLLTQGIVNSPASRLLLP